MLTAEFIRDHRSHLNPMRLDESDLIILRELYSDARTLRELPETVNVFVLGGEYDLLLHVTCASTKHLRDFVAHNLGSNQAFVSSATTLIFEQL